MKHIDICVHLATVAYQRLTALPIRRPINLIAHRIH